MRTIKVAYGLLNIKTQPHSPENYIKLFRDAARLQLRAKMGGKDVGLLSEPFTSEYNGIQYLYGNIIKYTEIDIEDSWINVSTLQEAGDDDKRKLKEIKDLSPNYRKFPFIFLPASHIMIFVYKYKQKSLSLNAAQALLSVIFAHSELGDTGPADVDIIQSSGFIKHIKELKVIKSVAMKISLPNGDSEGHKYASLYERMRNVSARYVTTEYKSHRNQSLVLTDELNADIEDTLRNGGTVVRGEDRNEEELTINSLDSPKTFIVSLPQENESFNEKLIQHAIQKNPDIKGS